MFVRKRWKILPRTNTLTSRWGTKQCFITLAPHLNPTYTNLTSIDPANLMWTVVFVFRRFSDDGTSDDDRRRRKLCRNVVFDDISVETIQLSRLKRRHVKITEFLCVYLTIWLQGPALWNFLWPQFTDFSNNLECLSLASLSSLV